ncbi:MAG: hypothetical protein V3U56_01375 [Syntrophobacteria bacterium]
MGYYRASIAILAGVGLQYEGLVRLRSNILRLPGGTPIFTVSSRQFMKHPGWGSINPLRIY